MQPRILGGSEFVDEDHLPSPLSRQDFEKEFERARKEKRAPQISGSAYGLDLSGLDFTSAYEPLFGPHTGFVGIDLQNCTMRHCRLTNTDFTGASFDGVDLSGSDFRDANLFEARMYSTKLGGANMCSVNLQLARFYHSNLMGTEFDGATFGETSIHQCDLSGAAGLGEAVHRWPTAIDSESLRLSAGGLGKEPEYRRQDFFRFLRNAGFDDGLIAVVRSWVGQPIEFHSIFLSHSSKDKVFARRLYRDLRDLGINCWLDEKQILPGDSILGEIDKGIRLWDRLLLVCSRNSLSPTTGWWVEQELERALAKERDFRRSGSATGTVIPIAIDDYIFTEWDGKYRSTILERHIGDFRNQDVDAYAKAVKRLINALDKSNRP
jgi:uncharacterized protein YjbI with pentapeptide repeats